MSSMVIDGDPMGFILPFRFGSGIGWQAVSVEPRSSFRVGCREEAPR